MLSPAYLKIFQIVAVELIGCLVREIFNHSVIAGIRICDNKNRINRRAVENCSFKVAEKFFVEQYSKIICGQNQHRRRILFVNSRTLAATTRLEPQHRQKFFKLPAERNEIFVEKTQLEKRGIGFEAVRHRQIGAEIISVERCVVDVVPFDTANRARPRDISSDTEPLPSVIGGRVTCASQSFFLRVRNFVVGDEDATTIATVLRVEQIDCVESRAATREEVDN